MKAIISCLSAAKKGRPLTETRHYALLPIANKELILHQRAALNGYEIIVLVKDDERLKQFLKQENILCIDEKDFEATVGKASLLIPGDLLFDTVTNTDTLTLLTTKGGSDEEGELKSLLAQHGLQAAREEIDAIRVNYPWELLNANSHMIKRITRRIDRSARIEEGVTITGEVAIGKKTIVKAGSCIEGPVVIGDDCTIGPMAHLRPETSIASNCTIGKTEVYDAVIMQGTVSKHAAYLGHSVLGEEVNVGAFTVTADYRHDAEEHTTVVGEQKVETGRRKLGAFIGDRARIAIMTGFYPGRKLRADGTTLPGEVVKHDK